MTESTLPDPPALARIRRVSRLLAAACLVMAAALPPLVVGWWLVATPSVLNVRAGLPAELWHDLPIFGLQLWQRAAGALVTLVPATLMVLALMRVRRCFLAYAAGQLFGRASIVALRGFAAFAFASALAAPLAGAAASVILTAGAPAGRRVLAIAISTETIFVIFVAGTIWLVAAVMAHAAALADENARFV